ncbi:zinc finger CCCH domain-containing protein 36 isoform X2 [Elaeis guineensis]|uniref:zinc finger CCCH domain-containing protein 36 isoform X2 n=1 Tax=Elaeis guineensis var. tenera TaxID=51953 RepID=UPI00094F5793
MPKRPAPGFDSTPERSAMADSPPGAGDGEESPEEERYIDEEEEEVEEMVEEEEDDEEGEEGSQGEGAEDEEEVAEVEGEEGSDSSDAEAHPGEDAHDASEKVESAGNGKDLKSVSSLHKRSCIDQSLAIHGRDGVGDLTASDSSPKLLAVDSEQGSAINDRDTSGKDTRSFHVNEDKPVVQSMIKSGSRYGKMDGAIEKDAPNPYTKINLHPPEDFGVSSIHTPQRRRRSSSPGAPFEISKKRPAIICAFFKQGWCIKGNSCSFLHLKEEDARSSQWAKENIAESNTMYDSMDHTGSREEAQRLKPSTSHEPLDSLNFEKPSKLDLQRALVRAYGGEGSGFTQFHDEYDKHSSKISAEEHFRYDISGSDRALNLPVNELRKASLVQEGYQRPIGVSPYLHPMDERHSASGEFLSRRYLDEGKLHQEMPKEEFLNDATFSRASPLSRNPLILESGYYSEQSSAAAGLYQNSNNSYSHGKMTEDVAIGYQQSRFPPPDPKYCSYSLSSSSNLRFDNSFQPLSGSPPVQTLAQTGTSSTSRSMPLSAEHFDSNRTFNFNRGYYGSRSASLPSNSSPYYSRSEIGSNMQQDILADVPPSAGSKIQVNSWEPSERFQSSFCAPASKPSPGSQYDPLIDSIEHPKAGNVTIQTSPITIIHNVSSQHISGHAPVYSSQKPLNSPHHSTEDIFDESALAHQFNGHIAPLPATGPDTVDAGKSSVPKDEKCWVPHVTDGENINVVDLGNNTRNQVDKARNDKESKALRIFRVALVDFVKELVKPFWREGHLSKDAHKMIVKKAVEKVIGSLQPHQIPSTAESINQYLSLSQTKLLKLVEAYVDKYAKS